MALNQCKDASKVKRKRVERQRGRERERRVEHLNGFDGAGDRVQVGTDTVVAEHTLRDSEVMQSAVSIQWLVDVADPCRMC